MAIDCSQLFLNSHLHLLVWDRFNSTAHDSALKLLADLLGDSRLSGNVMPLLHPLGRCSPDYDAYDTEFACGPVGTGLPQALTCDPKRRLRCGELWVQVAEGLDEIVWHRIRSWAEDGVHIPSTAWRSHREPLWQPLSKGRSDCIYTNARDPGAATFLAQLPADRVAWLLKAIWYRASVEIGASCVGPAGLACLDPCTQQQAIADLLARLLGPIRPADYGIAGAPDTLDPSLLWGSHLAAFAVNAVTTDMPGDVYQLEQYWHDGCVTWPHKYADLQAYLGAIQKARC